MSKTADQASQHKPKKSKPSSQTMFPSLAACWRILPGSQQSVRTKNTAMKQCIRTVGLWLGCWPRLARVHAVLWGCVKSPQPPRKMTKNPSETTYLREALHIVQAVPSYQGHAGQHSLGNSSAVSCGFYALCSLTIIDSRQKEKGS